MLFGALSRHTSDIPPSLFASHDIDLVYLDDVLLGFGGIILLGHTTKGPGPVLKGLFR